MAMMEPVVPPTRDQLFFEEEWPALEARLKRHLAKARVSPWLRDDVIQETGLRLFRIWERVDVDRSPWGLAVTIANHVLWDERNRTSGREVPSEIPDLPLPLDVEKTGIARIELARVQRGLLRLSTIHRDVLLAEVGGEPIAGKTPDAIKMLRMRARRRLHAIMDEAPASGIVALGGMRQLARKTSDLMRRLQGSEVAAASAAGFFAVTLALVSPGQIVGNFGSRDGNVRGTREWLAVSKLLKTPMSPAAGMIKSGGPSSGLSDDTVVAGASSDEEDEVNGYGISFGGENDPARGQATLALDSDGDGFQPSAPECEHEVSANRVGFHCTVETPTQEVHAGSYFEIDP